MSLIEGLGDEVTIVFALLTIILVAVIAWVSTHTREIPFISVIVVELSRRSEHDRQAGTAHVDDTSSSPNETNTPDSEVVTKETNQNSSNESAEAANVTGNAVSQDADEIESTNSGSGSTLTGSSPVTDLLSTQGVEMSSNEGLNAISEIVHDSVGSDSLTGSLQSAEVAAGSSVARDATTRSDTMVSDTTACDTTVSDATLTNTTEHDMKSELRHRRLAFFDGSKHSSSQLEDTVSLQTSKTSPDSRPSNSEVNSELSHAAPSNSVAASETESATGTPFTASSPHSEVEGESASIDTENLGEHSTSSSRSHDAGDGVNEADGSGSEIRVRLKYLNDTQRLVYTQPSQTVQEFRRTHFASELANNKLVRFIFNGQDLRNDGYTLQSYNIVDNSVVHCLVTQTQQTPNTVPNNDLDLDLDLGHLMLPLFGFILAVIWYLRFTYRQYFNAMSTLCLVGVTFLFFLGVVSSYNGHRRRVHAE